MPAHIDVKTALESYRCAFNHAIGRVDQNEFERAFLALREAIIKDQQIFICGNGGSAAIANHFTTDFFKGVRTTSTVFPRVFSLSSNGSLLSAIANDIGYDQTFAYQLEALSRPKDILIVVSSSGNSVNVDEAMLVAKLQGMIIIGLSAFYDDSLVNTRADIKLHVPVHNYGLAEDIHSSLLHVLSQSLRKEFAVEDADISRFTF